MSLDEPSSTNEELDRFLDRFQDAKFVLESTSIWEFIYEGIEKRGVEALSGVRFELRALRRTYGQMLLDGGTSIETASIALGHRSVNTTQAYYCQKSLDTVNSEVLRALEDTMPGIPGTKNPLISRTDDFTGYA